MARRIGGRTGVAVCTALMIMSAACGSSKSSSGGGNGSTTTTSFVPLPKSTKPGNGVTATSIKVGVALIDFSQIRQFTDTIRSEAEQKQIYQIYIDNVNANGGINGRKIVP